MKPILVLWLGLLALFLAPAASAVAPATLSYQGVLTDANGVVVPPGLYTLKFEVFTEFNDVTPVFEQELDVEVTHGLYNVILSGNSGAPPGDLAMAFDDQNQGRYMQVTIVEDSDPQPSALDGIVLSPRQEIASVPYALTALSVAEAPALPVREVVFVTSSFSGAPEITNTPAAWNTLRNSDGSGDLEAAVTPPSADCTVEVTAAASFYAEGSGTAVLARIVENGAAVGVSTVSAIQHNNAGGSVAIEFVRANPAALTPLTYTIRARSTKTATTQGVDNFICGQSCTPEDDAGAWIKIVMECQE